MNTVLLPDPPSESEPPFWTIVFADGTTFSSDEGLWSEVADLLMIDTVSVWQTRKMVRAVFAASQDVGSHMLVAPQECAFFSYKREAVALDGLPAHWLYTCFGYLLPEYRVTLTISASGCCTHVSPHTVPFSL